MVSLQLKNVTPLFSGQPLSPPSLLRPSRRVLLMIPRISISKNAHDCRILPIMDYKVNPQVFPGKSITSESYLNNYIPIVSDEDRQVGKRTSELSLIADAAADRADMHAVVGEQRNNWNVLLLNSLNSLTLFASISAGLSAIPLDGSTSAHNLAFKFSSIALYLAATTISLVINYLQPSQLAEEQRNAARLFKQLERRIRTTLSTREPSCEDVEEAMERVLAIDQAYPLALLGVMLVKFPQEVEPAVWWPKKVKNTRLKESEEKMMLGVLDLIKKKDTAEFLRLANKVLTINKLLAICGPMLTGVGALGALFTNSDASWAVVLGVVGGALATVVNTMEHGGQVGMVFEMYRNCAGYYRHIEEEIEESLGDRELLEMKIALQLGRSVSELRDVASSKGQLYAGKLF